MGLRSWLHSRRRTPRSEHELREFAYLDDVSIYSLYASLKGFIPTELRQTAATSRRRGVSLDAGVAPGVAHAGAGGRVETEASNSTELLGKAVVQSTFKDLYELVAPRLVLKPLADPMATHTALPTITPNLSALSQSDALNKVAIPTHPLRRGALVELDVQLEAEPIFRAGTVFAALFDLIRESPSAFGIPAAFDLQQAGLVSQVLGRLLGGLVPVRGRVLNYSVAEAGDEAHIVCNDLLGQLAAFPDLTVRPLILTGMAEPRLFWKDPQLVLFAEQRYRVFARLAHDGVQRDWSPIKLADVLRRVAPDAAEGLVRLNDQIGARVSSHVSSDRAEMELSACRDVLVDYATKLATRLEIPIDAGDLETIVPSHLEQISFRSVPEVRAAFGPVTQALETKLGRPVDHAVALEYRAAAIAAGGFSPDGQWVRGQLTLEEALSDGGSTERFLDSEIIAIYW